MHSLLSMARSACVAALLEGGADPSRLDDEGRTPAEAAEHPVVAQRLRRAERWAQRRPAMLMRCGSGCAEKRGGPPRTLVDLLREGCPHGMSQRSRDVDENSFGTTKPFISGEEDLRT